MPGGIFLQIVSTMHRFIFIVYLIWVTICKKTLHTKYTIPAPPYFY